VYEQITRASKESGIKFTPNDLRETGARRLFEPEAFNFIKSRKLVYKILIKKTWNATGGVIKLEEDSQG